jgi:outer membrane protein assembly factor BamB
VRAGRSWSLIAVLIAALWPGPAAAASPPGWAQDGYGPADSGFNPAESRLVPARLSELKRQWTITATGRQVCASQAAPVTGGGRLFLAGRESIGAYDAETGRPLWTHAYTDPMDTYTPRLAVVGDTVLAGAGGCQSQSDPSGYLIALDAATGALRWEAGTETPDVALTVDRGVVVVGGEDAASVTTTAFSLATGEQLWVKQLVTAAAGVSAAGTLLLTGDDNETGPNGAIAVDITTGRTRWRTDRTWSVLAADPTGGYFLVNDPSGALVKVAADTGKIAWTHRGAPGPVAVDTQRAYVATAGTLLALDWSTGRTTWTRTGYGQLLRPVIAGGILYAVTRAVRVDALNAATGRPLTLPVHTKPADHAVVAGGWLYLTDGSHLDAYTTALTP